MNSKWVFCALFSVAGAYAMKSSQSNIVLQQINHQKYLQIIALKDGTTHPLGWINYMPASLTDKRWQIACVGVHKNHRNRGIASLLFKSCFADLKEKNAITVVWDCSPLEPGTTAEGLACMYEAIIHKHIMPHMPGILMKRATPWATIKMSYTINQANTTSFTA